MLTSKKSDCNVTIRRKRGFKSVLWITMIAVLFSVFAPVAGNSIARAASPAEYYQSVEKKNLNKQIDALTESYGDYIKSYQKALTLRTGAEVTMEAVFAPDLAKELGIEDLKSIKTSTTTMSKGDVIKASTAFFVNGKSLTSMETYFNLEGLYYFLIPDLNKAYLKLSLSDLTGTTNSSSQLIQDYMKDPISEKALNKLLKKYAFLATDKISKVDMTKNDTLSVNKVSAATTRLTAHIDQKTALEIAKDILNAAKKDKELKNLCTGLGLCTGKAYDAEIKSSLEDINSELKDLNKKKSSNNDDLIMSVWVDGKGNIIGRSLKEDGQKDPASFGYQTVTKGTTLNVKAWVKGGSDSESNVSIKGSFTKKLSGISGSMTLNMEDGYSPDLSYKLSLKDFKHTVKNDRAITNGEIILSGDSMDGVSVHVKCAGDTNKQDMELKLMREKAPMITITATSKEVAFEDFNMPSSSDKVYDLLTESDKYMLESDVVNYLKGIKDKSDVKAIDDYVDRLISDLMNVNN